MSQTIAVTAATGHLGRLVIDELLERVPAEQVVAVVRDPAKADDIAAKGVDVRVADYDDPAALRAALEGVDRVLLISGNEVGQRVPQHTNVVHAAKDAGVSFIGYTSAPKAADTDLILAPEHKATEEVVQASGIPYSIMRNNWYYENYGDTVLADSGVVSGFALDNPPTDLPATTQIVQDTIQTAPSSVLWFEALFSSEGTSVSQTNGGALVNGSVTGTQFMELVQAANDKG